MQCTDSTVYLLTPICHDVMYRNMTIPCALFDNKENIVDHAWRQRTFFQRVHTDSLSDDKSTKHLQ